MRGEVDLSGGAVVQALMRAFIVIDLEVVMQPAFQCRYGRIVLQINVLVFDVAPQSFDKDVVECAPTTIDTDADVGLFQFTSEIAGRKLHPLIGVENVGMPLV